MANFTLLLLLAMGTATLGLAAAYQWKSRKIKLLSTTLDQLKSSFSEQENKLSSLRVFVHTLQEEKEKLSIANHKLKTITHSLYFNIQQLEADRQGIIDAFNTYKNQTVSRIEAELSQTKDSNITLQSKYKELLDLQEEKVALVIDLAHRREVKSKLK